MYSDSEEEILGYKSNIIDDAQKIVASHYYSSLDVQGVRHRDS